MLRRLYLNYFGKSAAKFGKKRESILNVFTKIKADLQKSIAAEEAYVEELNQKEKEIVEERKLSEESIQKTMSIFNNIQNLIN